MAEKLFYSMGEVSEMFDVNPSLLRYWEEQFPALRPKRNKKGNRHYSPADIELIKVLYHLIKERGMTLDGARKALRHERKAGEVVRNAELLERLQHIRALLEEVREDLKGDGSELVEEGEIAQTDTPAPDKGGKAVVKFDDEPKGQPAEASREEKPRPKRTRKKRNDDEKELFAFYEQSLF